MVITLLPVLIIEFPHSLIAVISCVKSSLLNQCYLKLVVYTIYCPHLAMNLQLKNFAITHFIPEKVRAISGWVKFLNWPPDFDHAHLWDSWSSEG